MGFAVISDHIICSGSAFYLKEVTRMFNPSKSDPGNEKYDFIPRLRLKE